MCVLIELEESDSKESENQVDLFFEQMIQKINNYANELHFGIERNFALVLGNTGAGKSTLTSLLTGAQLQSKETVPGSYEYLIVDEKGLISGESTTVSKTIIPELMNDTKNRVTYYDCPGFNDSRSDINDISVTYLIQQLIKYAKQLKLVFAVNYNSVRIGAGDRCEFIDLAKHAVTFVKHFDKYRDSIALIVTKVDSRCPNDHQIIDLIGKFLNKAKSELEEKQCSNDEEIEFNKKKIEFIKILLQTNEKGEYNRIGVMRMASEGGPIDKMQVLLDEKSAIQRIIKENIRFVRKENDDFGYSISEESKISIHKLIGKIQSHLIEDVTKISDEIKKYYLQQEKYIFDLKTLEKSFTVGYNKLRKVQSNNPISYVEKLISVSNDLEIGLSFDNSHRSFQHLQCIEFLKVVCDDNVWDLLDVSSGLKSTLKYIEDSLKWYIFLIHLYKQLSAFEVQSLPKIGGIRRTLVEHLVFGENIEKDVNELGLKTFLPDIDSSLFSLIENIQVNSYKANSLQTVLDQTINSWTESTENSLIVKGINVKFSDVIKEFHSKIKFIKVFALNNIFIDEDFDGTGKKIQLSIIAPNWHVINQRKIILSGSNGEPHAQNDAKDNGADGKPGNPGGPSGHFMAIGNQFFNDESLTIFINGGNGGPGQKNGNCL